MKKKENRATSERGETTQLVSDPVRQRNKDKMEFIIQKRLEKNAQNMTNSQPLIISENSYKYDDNIYQKTKELYKD